jgi:hypothetical protein
LTYSFWFSLSLRIMQTSLGFRLLDCSVFTLYNQFLRFPSVALLINYSLSQISLFSFQGAVEVYPLN